MTDQQMPSEPAPRSQFRLLAERRFGPYFLTQFAGALNDNIFKQALIALTTFQIATLTTLSAGVLVNLASGLYILPFFIFSATAGQLADKYEKTRIIRAVKAAEIVIMLIGAAGFLLSNLPLLLSTLFLMGTHSAFFGPVKYSILPQHLNRDELVGGNALVETGTFLAILIGTIAGGLGAGGDGGVALWIPVVTVAVAVVGYWSSRAIPITPAPSPELKINWNIVTETWRALQFARERPVIFKSILGVSWFWFFGALFVAQLPIYAKDYLGGGQGINTLLLAVFSIGTAIGALGCERLSGHKVEIGLVPFGSIGLSIFAFDLYFASPDAVGATGVTVSAFLSHWAGWRILFDLTMIGVFGGLFIVPLYALIQSRTNPAHQSRVIAVNNIVNAFFMVVAAGLAAGLISIGATIPQLFLAAAIGNGLVAIYIYKQVPEFLMRFLAWLLIHSVYRLEKSGLENIPERGAAVIVCNHVSFVDAIVIMAASPRPIRFVMDHQIFKVPVLNFIFRESRAIPIASGRVDPVLLERAYEDIAKALDAGELVGLFPEGRITDTGDLNPFRNGIQRIINRTPVPVVPMALRGLWGSFFSRVEGRAMKNPFRRGLLSRIGLVVDQPWPPGQVSAAGLEQRVRSLRGDWR